MDKLNRVKIGDLEVETNCPWVGLMADPKDYHDVDGPDGSHKRWECDDKDGKSGVSCEQCLLGAQVALLLESRELLMALLTEIRSQAGARFGPSGIPIIETRTPK